MSDSDDDDLLSVRKIITRSKSIIDLTLDDDDNRAGDKNAIETTSNLLTYSPRAPSSSLQKSLAHAADDPTTPTTVATSGRKPYPWKNVPRWSKLYDKVQQYSATTELERPLKDSRGPVAERPENSPEVPETPTVALESVRRGDGDHSDDDDRDHNGGTQTATSTSMVAGDDDSEVDSEDGPAIVDISELTTVEVLDKRLSLSGVEYRCEFEPLWLSADLAERVQMGRVHIRSYENGLVRDRWLKTLRVRKRKFSEM